MTNPPERWLPGVAERLQHYVYLLIDPTSGTPFYVGKGFGNRCFSHVEAARRTEKNAVGDYEKLTTIRAIEAGGRRVRIDILRHGLSEEAALDIESAAIDLLELDQLTNRVAGHESQRTVVEELNARLGAPRAVIRQGDRIVLIRIARLFRSTMSAEELYEATRKWWRVGGPRRQVGSPRAPEWAFAVHDSLVRAVFRIEKWLPANATDVEQDHKRRGRWCFVGHQDVEMEKLYVPTSVKEQMSRSSQSPLLFLNCGK